jgi:hypothetical protein
MISRAPMLVVLSMMSISRHRRHKISSISRCTSLVEKQDEEEMLMQYGFTILRGDAQIDLAVEAEEAGWDGVFYWDGIYIKEQGPMFDPWVMRIAIAMNTKRVRLGAELTPLLVLPQLSC